MSFLAKVLLLAVAVLIFDGCATPREANQPRIYRGGQYYEDAVHAEDLKSR
jgi:hypothetical protein